MRGVARGWPAVRRARACALISPHARRARCGPRRSARPSPQDSRTLFSPHPLGCPALHIEPWAPKNLNQPSSRSPTAPPITETRACRPSRPHSPSRQSRPPHPQCPPTPPPPSCWRCWSSSPWVSGGEWVAQRVPARGARSETREGRERCWRPRPRPPLSHVSPIFTATPAAAGRFSWGWPLPYSYPYTRGPWMTYGRAAGYGPRAGWLGGPYGG